MLRSSRVTASRLIVYRCLCRLLSPLNVACPVAVARGASASRGVVAALLRWIRLVEYILKCWGVCWGWGDPSFLGRVWTHAPGVVFRAADRAAEDFCGLACSVVVCYERDPPDEGLPLSEGVLVFRGGEYVDVPDWLLAALACANVFLSDKVEAADGYRPLEVTYGIIKGSDYGGEVVSPVDEESFDRSGGFRALPGLEKGVRDDARDFVLSLLVRFVEEDETPEGGCE